MRALAERLVIAVQSDDGTLDRVLLDEQASVLLRYLGGLIFAFANGSTEPITRDDITRQMRAVIVGVAVEHRRNR